MHISESVTELDMVWSVVNKARHEFSFCSSFIQFFDG